MNVHSVERDLRRYPCAYCGAEPGHPCRTRSGRRRADSHAERFYTWHDDRDRQPPPEEVSVVTGQVVRP